MRVGVSLRKLEDLPPEVHPQSEHWNPKDPPIPGVFIRGGLQSQAYQYHIQWEGQTKFGEEFRYSPEQLEVRKQELKEYPKVVIGKNYLIPSEEIREPVPAMGIPTLDVAHHSRLVNYALSKQVEEVYVSPLEPHVFAVSPHLEPLFAIWRNIGTVTHPTLKAAAL